MRIGQGVRPLLRDRLTRKPPFRNGKEIKILISKLLRVCTMYDSKLSNPKLIPSVVILVRARGYNRKI